LPDLGLTKAIGKAVREGATGAKVVRPGETEAFAREAAEKAARARAKAGLPPEVEAVVEPVLKDPVMEMPTGAPKAAAPTVPKEGTVEPKTGTPVTEAEPPTVNNGILTPRPLTNVERSEARIDGMRTFKANIENYDVDASYMPNFEALSSARDVDSVVADLATRRQPQIDLARRGVIPDAEIAHAAKLFSVTPENLKLALSRQPGQQYTPEVLYAVKQMVVSGATRLKELAGAIYHGQATDADRLAFVRQQQLNSAILDQFMGARAEWGRAGRVLNAPMNASKIQMRDMREMLDRLGGTKNMDTLAKAVYLADDPSQVVALASKFGKARLVGTLNEWVVTNLLSGPKTLLVNAYGSAIQLMNIAETAVAAHAIRRPVNALGRALTKYGSEVVSPSYTQSVAARLGRYLTAEEGAMVGEASAMLHGTLEATKTAWRIAALAFRTGKSIDDLAQFESAYPKAISAENWFAPEKRNTPLGRMVDGFGTLFRIPIERVMVPTDEMFKTIAYRAEVERQAYVHVTRGLSDGSIDVANVEAVARDFMENTPQTAQDAAEAYMRDASFQAPLGDIGQSIEHIVRVTPGLKIILPFVRAPTNIFKAGLGKRSPTALLAPSFWADVRKGGRARDIALARIAMGSATAALVANYVLDGTVTGGGPKDQGARLALGATGWQPYSIRVKNPFTGKVAYHSYARFEPISSILGATANTVEISAYLNAEVETLKDDDEKTSDAAKAVVAGIVNNTLDKTFMKSMSDTMQMLDDPVRHIDRWSRNFAVSALAPWSSFRNQMGQVGDPYIREAWTISDALRAKSGIPGWSEDVPVSRDLFGLPRPVAQGSLLGVMSPMPDRGVKYNPVAEELATVMDASHKVPVAMPEKSIEGMKLTAPEWDKLIQISRTEPIYDNMTFQEKLDDTMSSDLYAEATPEYKAELLKRDQLTFDSIARGLMETDPEYMDEDFAERLQLYRLKKERIRFGEEE
jgi:hypothetical protein